MIYGQPNSYQGSGLPMDFYNPMNQSFNNPIAGMMNPHSGNMGELINQQKIQQVPQPLMNGVPVDPRQFETPEIVMNDEKTHRPRFTVSDSKSNTITVDISTDAEVKERKRKKKEGNSTLPRAIDKSDSSTGIVVSNEGATSVSGEVVDSTIYTYGETTNLLHETLGQIDAINGELVQEFNAVRRNRTMKNKYNVLIGISENIGSMLNNRLSAIKEINNCISKSNEMDYKKYKDREAMQATMNDDKYISDIYQAFLQNPGAQPTNYNLPEYNPNAYGSGIVRANIVTDNTAGTQDIGYLNYIAGLTPEQNLMRYENNPDVKQVVVYDPNTGNRFFQVMNTRTGEVIPNVPVYGEDIMADTVLNTNTGIAKNINLNETFPIVTINGSVASQY